MEDREREIQTILDSLPTQSLNAINRLRQFGRPALPALAVALKYPDPFIRAGAARAIARMKEPLAATALLEATADPDAGVRLAAISALVDTPGQEAVDALAQALHSCYPLVRDCAARALALRSLPVLRSALSDPDPVVRRAAARGVGYYGRDSESIPLVHALIQDPHREVRVMAVWALAWIGKRHQAAVLALLEALRHEDEKVRATAAHCLGRSGDPVARGALVSALYDPDKQVVLEAIRALGAVDADVPGGRCGIGDYEAIPVLLTHLQSEDAEVRVAAAGAIAYILAADPRGQRNPETVSALLSRLDDADARVRSTAAAALAEAADPKAVPALVHALDDEEWLVRAAAAGALGALGDESVVPILEAARQDIDIAVSKRVSLALKQLRTRLSSRILR